MAKKTLYDDWFKKYLKLRGISENDEAITISRITYNYNIKKIKSIKQQQLIDLIAVLEKEFVIKQNGTSDTCFSIFLRESGCKISNISFRNGKFCFGSLTCFETPEEAKKEIVRRIEFRTEDELKHSEEENEQIRERIRKIKEEREKAYLKFKNYCRSLEPVKFGREGKGSIVINGERIKFWREGEFILATGLKYTSTKKYKAIRDVGTPKKIFIAKATLKGGELFNEILRLDILLDSLGNYHC